MKINFSKFRLWRREFRIVSVEPQSKYKRRKIVVCDVTKKEKEAFEMSLPFRIYDPDRNLQILEDKKGRKLTKQESDIIINRERLNMF